MVRRPSPFPPIPFIFSVRRRLRLAGRQSLESSLRSAGFRLHFVRFTIRPACFACGVGISLLLRAVGFASGEVPVLRSSFFGAGFPNLPLRAVGRAAFPLFRNSDHLPARCVSRISVRRPFLSSCPNRFRLEFSFRLPPGRMIRFAHRVSFRSRSSSCHPFHPGFPVRNRLRSEVRPNDGART